MTVPTILIVGSRHDIGPANLAGLLAGNAYEDPPQVMARDEDTEQKDRDLVERFARFCADRATHCVWLRHMQDACLSVSYDAGGAALRLRGLADLEGQEISQDTLKGVWYRGLPGVPAFATEEDQAYAERETEAFWEGYCHHASAPVLNQARTAGLRPATWEPFLIRHLVGTALALPTPCEGLSAPRSLSRPGHVPRRWQTLSTRNLLNLDAAAKCAEQATWVELPSSAQLTVFAFHVGSAVVLARRAEDGTIEPVSPSDVAPPLVAALSAATQSVGQFLGEAFGAVLWDVDGREERFLFRNYTPNPDGRTLAALEAQLFPLLWQFLTSKGGKS